MVNSYRKIQNYVIASTIIVMACLIIYALGFYTPFAGLNYIEDYIEGAEVFYAPNSPIQAFNRHLLLLSIIGMLIVVTFYLFSTANRKIYYASNYLISVAYSSLCIYIFVYMVRHLTSYKIFFMGLPFEQCEKSFLCNMILEDIWLPRSTFIFDLGMVLAYLLVVSSVVVLINAIIKFVLNKRLLDERKFIKSRIGV